MYDAYARIFERCGLRVKVAEADTGAIGGKWSHEFMVLAEAGEDGLVECPACAYAANLERAERAVPDAAPGPAAGTAPEEVPTPGVRTIEQLTAYFGCPPDRFIKTLIYRMQPNPSGAAAPSSAAAAESPLAVLVPGDREVNEVKLARKLDAAKVTLAEDALITAVTGAPVGFAGPVGLRIPVYADAGLRGSRGAITGANKNDAHLRNVTLERDAAVTAYDDFCIVQAGDACPKCGRPLQMKRGIEVGHVFKLGTKYSDAFNASYLDENGQKRVMVMGCYGIGVTRTLQAVVEQSHDADGIIWPVAVAPYHVAVLALSPGDARGRAEAEKLTAALEERGFDVLLDDRDERPGVKFKDADLLGFPVRVVVSDRSLAQDGVEVKKRTERKGALVPLAEAGQRIADLCKEGS
jgi:prolyl-tRNA synthetase